MSDPGTPQSSAPASGQEQQSALFAQLVIQQSNLAMMLLGKVAHPETGEVIRDIEAARLFIDTLEMLEAKTKGNLTFEEHRLLENSLTELRFRYLHAISESQKS